MATEKFNLQLNIGANVDAAKGALNQFTKQLSDLKLPNGLGLGLEKTLKSLENEIENFEKISSKGFSNMGDVKTAEKSWEKIRGYLFDINNQNKKLQSFNGDKLIPKEVRDRLSKIGANFKTLQSDLAALNKEVTKDITEQTKQIEKQNRELEKAQNQIKAYKEANNDTASTRGGLKRRVNNLTAKMEAEEASNGTDTKAYKDLQSEFDRTSKELDKLNKAVDKNKEGITKQEQVVAKAKEAIKGYETVVQKLEADFDSATEGSIQEFREEVASTLSIDIDTLPNTVEELKNFFDNIKTENVNKAVEGVKELANSSEELGAATDQIGSKFSKEIGEVAPALEKSADEAERLTNQVSRFFELTNGVRLFKRALREAYETVKELDAAMTETAVVTDFTVSDMWSQLPEYTKRANELGVTTTAVYEAATLYYQQGLKTNEVNQLTNSTLKMARIAGLDAADATDRMTNALRGFNMELNETSAERVADVYSELAAITASDVDEISTAMTKTASIASSAGMEFKTTAAFLSQIIETTRESAETAGTAMKTVIARFQELKKSPEEIGEVDGEIVDANKIEGALRSVGVALRDEEGQFRNLDDVFLELAKKWNTLDKNTQRYIATMAAGSRQQSRFIAMMQDYDHTMELVSAANNSAGASQRQYEKTLDSLKSKLAKLENAWHEFVLGLANSDVIKGFVDGLTNLINKINELTFSSNAAGNTLKKFGMAFAVFKGGKVVTQKIVPNWVQSLLGLNSDNKSSEAGENYGKTFIEGMKNSLNKHNTEFSELFNNIAGAFDEGVEDLDLNTLRVSINDIDGSSRKLINAYDILNDSQKTFFNSASKEVIERWKNIAAISGEEKANRYLNDQLATQNALNGGGITKLLTRIGLLAKDTVNTIFNTTAEKANTKAKLAAIAAQMGLNSSMLLGIGIIAGVTLLIFGLVKAYKEIQEKSPEGQIKKLNEEFDSLQETISNNSEAIKTLENNFNDLTAKYDGLKELTRGTLEWNNAISDINTSVLELIDKYPELMQFVTRGENGELILDVNSESVQNILKDYQNQNQALQSSSTGLRVQKLQIETDAKYNDLGFNSRLNSVNHRKDTEDLALALVDGTIINATKDSINRYLVEKGITNVNGEQTTFKGDEQNIEELKEFGKALQAVTAEELSYGEIIANNAFLLSNADRLQGNEYEASNKLLTSNYVTDLIKNQSVSFDDYQKYAEEAYGMGAVYDEVKNEITDLSGATHLVNEQMIKTWKGQKETVNILNRFNSSVNSLDSSFVALLSDGSGANLTSDDIDKLNEGGVEQFWANVDEDLQKVFESRKEELEEVVQSASGQKEALNKYLKQFDFTVTDNLTNGLMTGLQEKLQSILELSGSGAARAIGSTINSIASKLSADEQVAFINQINGLDWSNIQAINELETTLKDLGIAVEQTELDTLITQIKNFSDAISNVTFEEIMESIKTLKGLQDDLNERSLTNNRVFSYDEMMSYIGLGANAKDFTAIGLDEFEYDGKLIDLASSIDKNVATIVGNESKALESKISEGELLEGKTDQNLSALNYIFSDASNASNSAKLNALYNLGYDTSALDAESITSDQLNDIWSKIYQNFLELGANREELNQNSTWMRQMQIATMSGQEMLDQKDIENIDKVMNDLIESNQGYNKTLSDMKKSLKDSNSQLADNDRLLKAHVIDYNNASKQLEELNQTLNDNYDIISDEANKGYPEYNAALEQIAISTNNAFGSDINADFVAKHLEDFKKLAEGGEIAEEGFANLTRFINEEYINSLVNAGIITENAANDISSIINQLDGLEFGIDGTADFSAIFNALNDVIHNADITAAVLRNLGYEVTFQEGTIYKTASGVLTTNEKYAQEMSDFLGYDKGYNYTKVKIISAIGSKVKTATHEPLRNTSGGGSEKEYSAENPYDKLYNLNEKINEEISKRNRLEKQYQRLIAQHKETAEAVAKAYRDQVDSLRRSKALDETFVTERTAQLQQFVADNSKFSKYGTFVNDKVQIDYDSIDDLAKAVDTEEEEKFFDELIDYISKLEQWDDELDAKAESIIEYDIQIAQLYEEQRDAYLSFEDRVINAITQVRQNQIDAKRDISESIKKADDDLMSAVRSNIDKIRQDRENENSEEEIAKKERRLAYLRQDTTGANQNEILSLEKELEDLKTNYSDSLVDQSLDALQEQQDAAAEQREREIAIMESQLQWDQENGVIAQQAYQMIEATINGNKVAIETLQAILEEGESTGSLSVIAYDKWLDDFQEGLSEAGGFLINDQTESYNKNSTLNSYTNSALGSASIGSNPTAMETPNSTNAGAQQAASTAVKNNPYGRLSDYTSNMGYTKGGKLYTGDKVKALQWALNDLGYSTGSKGIDGSFGPDTAAALTKFQKDAKAEGFDLGKYGANGWYGPYTAAIFKAKGYATGGLADYTGPAWLDGTPSKPEIVLNARDSENLIQLRNLLRDGSLGGGSTGDNYFSFDINIDELGSDYDVDKMADRIKELIYRDAMYRNVNAVGLQR